MATNTPMTPPATNSSPRTRSDVVAIGRALSLMFERFRERAEDAERMVKTYCEALDDLPTWAIAEACDRFGRGRVPDRRNNTFSPTTAELHAYADGLVAERELSDRVAAMKALPPPAAKAEPSDEERRRVAPRMDDLRRELRAAAAAGNVSIENARSERAERARRQLEERRVRECEAAGVDPSLGLSVELARRAAAWSREQGAIDA